MKQKQSPVTIAAITAVVMSQPADWTRAEICKALGRKKTSHMIRMIEAAVEAAEVNRFVHYPDKGQPYYVYSCLDHGIPF